VRQGKSSTARSRLVLPPLSIDVAKISHRFSEVRQEEWVMRGRFHPLEFGFGLLVREPLLKGLCDKGKLFERQDDANRISAGVSDKLALQDGHGLVLLEARERSRLR
jgi:hypothetical protein